MRILIVEDEEALALGLKFNFEQEGYEVLLAGDGPTALRIFQTADPRVDLIILDLMLPGMSGYEICSAIRTVNKLVPVIVLSARTLVEDRMHAFDVGTDQYITKPFALPELLNRVKNLLERYRTLRTDHVSTPVHTMQSCPASTSSITSESISLHLKSMSTIRNTALQRSKCSCCVTSWNMKAKFFRGTRF